jgi:short-subunit dehydrogenase
MDLFHTGVDVRLILPGAIATEIWNQPGNDDPVYDGPFEPPETVAAGIIDAIEGDAFECYVPDMRPIVEWKTAGGFDDFMAGAVAFADAPRATRGEGS